MPQSIFEKQVWRNDSRADHEIYRCRRAWVEHINGLDEQIAALQQQRGSAVETVALIDQVSADKARYRAALIFGRALPLPPLPEPLPPLQLTHDGDIEQPSISDEQRPPDQPLQ